MSDPLLPPDQRSFTCPSCDGRIVIPVDLPPTTGPCPHCEATITSPEPEPEVTHEEIEVIEADLPVPSPAKESAAQAPVETTPEPTDSKPEVVKATPSVTTTREPTSARKTSKSSKNPIVLALVAVLGICAIAAGLFFSGLLGGSSETTPLQVVTPASPNQPSRNALEAYLAAQTVEAKLAHVLNADELKAKIESFYQENSVSETDRGINTFKAVPLPGQDQSKGFVLFDSPSAANGSASSRILAFIKKTDDGLKLDWEVFAQTKYRTFRKFYETPQPGASEVFRVLVKEVATSPAVTAPGTKSYQLQDPANRSDTLVVSVESASSVGLKLSTLSDRDQIRPATIELEWTDSSELKIKRFVCWEFLHLGGDNSAK